MNIKAGLSIAAVVISLGATSMAMEHGRYRDRDDNGRGNLRLASWHSDRDDHDKKGYEKGKKNGWENGSLPPGKARKESKEWQKQHKHEADWHRKEAREREHEARENRHRSHDVVVHRQPQRPTNVTREATLRERAAAVKRANEEKKRQAQVNHK
jgi:hypothetical protein